MQKFLDLLKRFHNDERGAFLALFGILAIVLIATAGATVDFTSVQNARSRAQVALDAAALALQPRVNATTYANEAAMELDIKTLAKALLLDRLNDANIKIVGDLVADGNKNDGSLTLTVKLNAPLYFVALVGVKEMNMTIISQATKGSQDLEISVALDVTGSMDSNGKIDALKTAATNMVKILVPETQTGPTYTRVALVPWSMGVNVTSDIVAARGTVIGTKGITAAAWQSGTNKTVTNNGITKSANSSTATVFTTSAVHGLAVNDTVWLSGIANANNASGWTALNDKKYVVATTPTTTTFTLTGVNTSANSYVQSSGNRNVGGTVRKCLNPNCEIVVTSTGHGLPSGWRLYFRNIGGMTQLNSSSGDVTAETVKLFTTSNAVIDPTNTFALSGIVGPTVNYTAYTSGGTAQCVMYGCQYLSFTPQTSTGSTPDPRLFDIGSKCVTERIISPYQYTDTSPATAPVGLNYPGSSNDCPDLEVVPLTTSRTTLIDDTIAKLKAEGSTGGQVGTAWAWYMLSPEFKTLWPVANRPADYDTPNLVKIMVLMTDGSFNSVYCNGVISADSTTGSGSTDEHIYCNANNGNPFAQTKAICAQMKLKNIEIYTVGFDIADQSSEKDMLETCASEPKADHYKLASNAAALNQAFTDIAQDIAQLRLTE